MQSLCVPTSALIIVFNIYTPCAPFSDPCASITAYQIHFLPAGVSEFECVLQSLGALQSKSPKCTECIAAAAVSPSIIQQTR